MWPPIKNLANYPAVIGDTNMFDSSKLTRTGFWMIESLRDFQGTLRFHDPGPGSRLGFSGHINKALGQSENFTSLWMKAPTWSFRLDAYLPIYRVVCA
jgi:hypothetical protein